MLSLGKWRSSTIFISIFIFPPSMFIIRICIMLMGIIALINIYVKKCVVLVCSTNVFFSCSACLQPQISPIQYTAYNVVYSNVFILNKLYRDQMRSHF